MFNRLRLTNFKAWADTGDMWFKPLTMFLGTNSSGKSSIIQSLLLLKQTVQSPDRTVHLNFGGDEINDIFNFGKFDDVLTQNNEQARQFSISFDFTGGLADRVKDGHFECSYGKTSSGSVAIQNLEIGTNGRNFKLLRGRRGGFSIIVDDKLINGAVSRDFAPERSISFSSESISMLEKADQTLIQDLSLAIRQQFQNIRYLGPLRRKPERDYAWNKTTPGDMGSDGRGAIDALLASNFLKGNEKYYVVTEVSRWLKRMNIADKLEVRQQGNSGNRYELIIHQGETKSNIRDVGIGISQVLPVLVIAFFAPEGSTIILEEPEIHLHPLAQSELAELFVEVSRTRGVQFLVETHSEHIFRRMQTLIANKTIVLNEVELYFVSREAQLAKLNRLEVNEFGRLANWPEGFFGDALGETREQARLMFESQVRGS